MASAQRDLLGDERAGERDCQLASNLCPVFDVIGERSKLETHPVGAHTCQKRLGWRVPEKLGMFACSTLEDCDYPLGIAGEYD